MLTRSELARLIDHTLLRPEATAAEVAALAREGEALGVFAVCVSPNMLPLRTSLPVATVIGFPSGAHAAAVKAAEAARAVRDGAAELDMVVNLGAVKAGAFDVVQAEIATVRAAADAAAQAAQDAGASSGAAAQDARTAGEQTAAQDVGAGLSAAAQDARLAGEPTGAPSIGADRATASFGTGGAQRLLLKVIIESAVLSDEEIVACCRAAEAAGADFVKTSTGFHPAGGASLAAVRLMRETVGDRLGVKASGGIRTYDDACAYVAAGATRLGMSATAAVLAAAPEDAEGTRR